ncbi:energy transducer TonB [Stutzerimonas nosocomialis]|uniref:energy transducer TonB n=1 Tax=Stutzerimonas nosocomialis TaxID=1056496 RepID=UPI0011081356|nr:energy transducer TonB [Stutzerimonas nosocomialis]TLX54725.1 energy transducer TonB [Stutzerimonas nosocomialis]
MIAEARRRAFLDAMQVDSWLPRVELPFAAPSRAYLLQPEPEPEPELRSSTPAPETAAEPSAASPSQKKIEVPRPRVSLPEPKPAVAASPDVATSEPAAPVVPPPRFALQLLRAGSCLLLVELPTGEPFASRDPAYLLLKDLLRAAGLPDSPTQVGDGEPIRWPLLHGGNLDQGAQAARDYVQGVVAAELEETRCACLWLVGLPALRFAGEVEADACNRELNVEGIGPAFAMPGLEQMMEEPERKADVWKALRRSKVRWNEQT